MLHQDVRRQRDRGVIGRLFAYARARGAKPRFTKKIETLGSSVVAAYSIGSGLISVRKDLDHSDPRTWYIIAHEIGHHLDTEENPEEALRAIVALKCFENCRAFGLSLPLELRRSILGAESRAHLNAVHVLRQVGVDIPAHDIVRWAWDDMTSYRDAFEGDAWSDT